MSESNKVTHPNLLLNRDEIAEVKQKIHRYPWAAALFARVQAVAEQAIARHDANALREAAVCYALSGETRYGDAVREILLTIANEILPRLDSILDSPSERDNMVWTPMNMYAYAYDLTYQAFTAEEREIIEHWLRSVGQIIIAGEKISTTSRNLVFLKHINVGMLGYCLGDRELIEWGINDPGTASPPFYVTWGGGGLTQVLDTFIRDGYFWGETPIYALHYDVWGMLALAEAARHYDGADLYHHMSPVTGASIKSLLDGYIRMGYPRERTGIGNGSVRMATYGDGSTCFSVLGAQMDTYLAEGKFRETPDAGIFYGALEIAYKRYQDPGYAWLLSLNPQRDARAVYGGSPWGYLALTHGEPLPDELTPPPAPSGVYPEQGFAMLRSDETPTYWTSGALAAVITLGKYIGHGHDDYYSLILHGKGRLLYPDLNVIQYEKGHLGWTRDGIAHSTLLVDGESPTHGPFTTRQNFTPAVKYFAMTGTAFAGVTQTRALLMTKEYLLDVFHAANEHGEERTYDWVLHGFGRLYPGNPGAYRPTNELLPYYWSVGNEQGRVTDADWQADWIQRTAGVRPGGQFGPDWFAQEVGVRMSMLGEARTEVYYGDGGLVNGPPNFRIEGNPEGALPMIVARRHATETTFIALHEPYEGQSQLHSIRRLAETAHAVALAVSGPDFTDYLLLAFDEEEHTLVTADGESFTFRNYAYFRYPPGSAVILTASDHLDIRETTSLHTYFQPEELHLTATDHAEQEITLHLRCIGHGEISGRLRVIAPDVLQVEPPYIDIAPLREGEERLAQLLVRKAAGVSTGLYTLQLVPEEGLPAAPQTLTVSVGVVITLDRRVPHDKQTVIRAPGYMMKLDHYTGLPSWLLDADGQRRYAVGSYRTPLFTVSRLDPPYQDLGPCDSVWIDDNRFTCLTNPRTSLIVHEDRFIFAIAFLAEQRITWELKLSNFLELNTPLHKTTASAEIYYYPPTYHRQGLLITAPPRPADYIGDGFPLRVGQEIVFQFATEDEFHLRE